MSLDGYVYDRLKCLQNVKTLLALNTILKQKSHVVQLLEIQLHKAYI